MTPESLPPEVRRQLRAEILEAFADLLRRQYPGAIVTHREGAPPTDRSAIGSVPVLMKISSVAELLDCSPRTVRRRIDSGELPAVRENGRLMVRGDDLRAYIDALEAVGKTVTSRYRPRGPRRRVTVKL